MCQTAFSVVDQRNGKFHQKCHDFDCKHFRSPEFAIPPCLIESDDEEDPCDASGNLPSAPHLEVTAGSIGCDEVGPVEDCRSAALMVPTSPTVPAAHRPSDSVQSVTAGPAKLTPEQVATVTANRSAALARRHQAQHRSPEEADGQASAPPSNETEVGAETLAQDGCPEQIVGQVGHQSPPAAGLQTSLPSSALFSAESSSSSTSSASSSSESSTPRQLECHPPNHEKQDAFAEALHEGHAVRQKGPMLKLQICQTWENVGFCDRGDGCAFAHGGHELRTPRPAGGPVGERTLKVIGTSPPEKRRRLLMCQGG